MLNIGLMGTLVSNTNMGCLALTYSLIDMLENISREVNTSFSYTIFEFEKDDDKYNILLKSLNLDKNRVKFAPVGFLCKENWKLMVKKTLVNLKMINEIKKCDLIIDLTQGDSFTDIYGAVRFNQLTIIKELVNKMGKPLILGPQTYGPFNDEKNINRVRDVIEKATCVISRDKKSADYLESISDKKVFVTTDLAFSLPYERDIIKSDKIKVGINPSGLLCSNKSEGTKLATKLKTDYDLYLDKLINGLLKSDKYELHLIPHVSDDSISYIKCDEKVIKHNAFNSPIEAKNCISSMDIFIGSRMHATIGAFSSGVPTIPVAYSRKFAGLYEGIGYNYVVDLCELDTDEAVQKTLELVEKYQLLSEDINKSQKVIKSKCDSTKEIIKSVIEKVLLN